MSLEIKVVSLNPMHLAFLFSAAESFEESYGGAHEKMRKYLESQGEAEKKQYFFLMSMSQGAKKIYSYVLYNVVSPNAKTDQGVQVIESKEQLCIQLTVRSIAELSDQDALKELEEYKKNHDLRTDVSQFMTLIEPAEKDQPKYIAYFPVKKK